MTVLNTVVSWISALVDKDIDMAQAADTIKSPAYNSIHWDGYWYDRASNMQATHSIRWDGLWYDRASNIADN